MLETPPRVPRNIDGRWPLFHATPPSAKRASSTGSGPYIRRDAPNGRSKRKPEIDVSDQQAAAKEAVECRALARRVRHAFAGLEGIHVITTNQRGIAEIQRIQPGIFTAAAVSAVVDGADCKCVEGHRHEVPAVVAKRAREVDGAEPGRGFDPIAPALSIGRSTAPFVDTEVADRPRAPASMMKMLQVPRSYTLNDIIPDCAPTDIAGLELVMPLTPVATFVIGADRERGQIGREPIVTNAIWRPLGDPTGCRSAYGRWWAGRRSTWPDRRHRDPSALAQAGEDNRAAVRRPGWVEDLINGGDRHLALETTGLCIEDRDHVIASPQAAIGCAVAGHLDHERLSRPRKGGVSRQRRWLAPRCSRHWYLMTARRTGATGSDSPRTLKKVGQSSRRSGIRCR